MDDAGDEPPRREDTPPEVVAFIDAVTRIYRVDLAERTDLARIDGDVEVPGFAALEATLDDVRVRGWVGADGTVVLARRSNFGPILEALAFARLEADRDDDIDARIAFRLAWAYGDDFELVDQVEQGDCGLARALICPPARERQADGSTVLRFVLRKDGRRGPPCILMVAVRRSADGVYRDDVWQLAPRADDGAAR